VRYYLFIQDDENDEGLVVNGPYKSVAAAKKVADEDYDPDDLTPGMVFTIMVQDGTDFRQVFQAIVPSVSLLWL
jgi:hypothetical protein